VKEMADVTHEMAVAFLASERARGISGRSFNAVLSLVKGAFRHLRRQAGIADNPFDGIVSQEERTVHRIPFTPAELRAIIEAARDDAFCRPLLVAGMCTAMRRGDVCQLRWADVDMEKRFITVNTSKTGAKVTIPMFGMLYDELSRLPRNGEFCFPEQAALYRESPDGVARKLGQVFAAAGFVDADDDEDGDEGEANGQPKKAKDTPDEVLSDTEMLRRGCASLQGCTRYTGKVRANLLKVFERYMAGATSGDIRKEFGLSKGGVSTYLKRIEDVVGFPVVRQRRPKAEVKVLGPVHAMRPQGMKKVNQRGFHALRSTWVTLALTAGVPVDLVRKVTGHTTVETVLVHYFQPGREDFRRTLEKAMPALLTNGAPTREEQVRTILEGMTARTWKQDRARLLAFVG
jgi:integrase